MPLNLQRKRKEPVALPWRPDFKNPETLPDTKVIRTDFMLNFVAIAVAVILFSVSVILEYNIRTLKKAGKELQAQISDHAAENRRFLALSGQFNQHARTMEQVAQFANLPFESHQLLLDLVALKPEGVVYQSATIQPTVVRQGRREISRYQFNLQGHVIDDEDRSATQVIADLQSDIAGLRAFDGILLESALQSFFRQAQTDEFVFTIVVTLDPGK